MPAGSPNRLPHRVHTIKQAGTGCYQRGYCLAVDTSDSDDFKASLSAAFLPIRQSLSQLLPDASDGDIQSVRNWQRRRVAHLLVTSVGLWSCMLEMQGVNLRARIDRSSSFQSLYADDMVMYDLCDSIWTWSKLDGHRSLDEYDIAVARALTQFLDFAVAMEYGADIFKRTMEAIANLLVVYPELWDTMIDEAGYCACSDGLMDALSGARSNAERFLRKGK